MVVWLDIAKRFDMGAQFIATLFCVLALPPNLLVEGRSGGALEALDAAWRVLLEPR